MGQEASIGICYLKIRKPEKLLVTLISRSPCARCACDSGGNIFED